MDSSEGPEERDRRRVDAARADERVLRRPTRDVDVPRRDGLADDVAALARGAGGHEALADAYDLVEASSLGRRAGADRGADDEAVGDTVAFALDRLARRGVDRAREEGGATTGAVARPRLAEQEWSAEIVRLARDAAADPAAVADLVRDLTGEDPPDDIDGWGDWSLAVAPSAAAALVETLGGRWSAGGFGQLHRAATLEHVGAVAAPVPAPRVTGVGGVVAADPRAAAARVQHVTTAVPAMLTRRGVLTELRNTIAADTATSTVLLGPPGHGKSVAACAIAERVRSIGLAVVFVVPSRDLRALVVGLERVLLRLDTPQQTLTEARRSEAAEHAARLWALLDATGRRWLLVLDGAGPTAVGHPAWTRPPRHGHVIVTTTFGVPSQWAPSRVVEMTGLDPEEGARLLLDRLRGGRGAVGVEAELHARGLSESLDGMPLALARMGELVARAGGDLDGWARAVEARQGLGAVETIVDIALATLGADRGRAQELLVLLACFAPDEPLPTVVLALGAADALQQLEATGLLERGAGGGRDTVRVPEAISAHVGDIAGTHERERAERQAVALLHRCLEDLDPGVPQSASTVLGLEAHVVHLVQRRRSARSDGPSGGGVEVLRLADAAAVALMRCGQQESATSLLAVARAHVVDLEPDAPVALAVRLTEAWLTALGRGDLVRAERALVDVIADAERVLGPDDPTTLTAIDTLAWFRAERDDLDGAAELFERVLAARTRIDGADGASTLGTRHRLAWIRAKQGHVEEAMHEFEEVLTARVAILGSDHLDVYSTFYRWAWSQSRVGRHADAVVGFGALLDQVEAVLGPEHQLALLVRSRKAWARMWGGRAEAALDDYARLVPLQQKVLGVSHRRVLVNRHNVAALHLWLGQAAAAEAELSEVIAARRELHGDDHAFTLDSRELHAWAVLRLGRAEDAQRRLVAVLADRTRTLGPAHESTLATRYRLLRVLLHRGLVVTAEAEARDLLIDADRPGPWRSAYSSVPVVRGPLPVDSRPGLLGAAVRHTLAICCALQGRPHEARDLLQEVLHARVPVVGEDAPEVLLARDRLGWATALDDPGEGLRLVREVRDRRVVVLGADHPHTLTSEYRVAWALLVAGQTDAAREAYEALEPRIVGLVGDLDPQALRVRAGRARTLCLTGRAGEALALAEALYRDQLAVQGARAVDTLRAAEEIGRALAALGRRDEALEWLRDVAASRGEQFGDEHLDTVRARRVIADLLTSG